MWPDDAEILARFHLTPDGGKLHAEDVANALREVLATKSHSPETAGPTDARLAKLLDLFDVAVDERACVEYAEDEEDDRHEARFVRKQNVVRAIRDEIEDLFAASRSGAGSGGSMNDALRIQDLEQHVLVNRQTNQRRYDRMRAALTSLGEDRALGYDMALDALIALAGRGSENLSAGAPDGAVDTARLDWIERIGVAVRWTGLDHGAHAEWTIRQTVGNPPVEMGTGETLRDAIDAARGVSTPPSIEKPERITDLIEQTSDDEALRQFAEAMQDAERGGEADDVTLPYHIGYKIAALAFDHPSRYETDGVTTDELRALDVPPKMWIATEDLLRRFLQLRARPPLRRDAPENHSPSDSPPPTVAPVGDRDAMRDELFEEEAETCDHEGPPLLATGLRFECEREPGHDGPHSAFSRDEDRVEWDNDGNILRDPRREFSAPVGDQETPR